MESVGRLAGGIAHSFNNLLTGIIGNISLVAMETASDDPQKELLTEAYDAAESAAKLTRQLLAFSRKQVVDPKEIDLNDLISKIEKMLASLIKEDIDIRIVRMSEPAWVKADPSQIEQIVVNLALNAQDAMPEGGYLVIETERASLDEAACRKHPGLSPGDYVLLSVSDNGRGMTDEVKEHLFEPFFTTKPMGKGTGLGLAMVYGVIKQAGGSIDVTSEVGHGTTFKIFLPRAVEAAASAGKASRTGSMPAGTETVMVVEDDATVNALAVRVLSRLGYKVLHFLSPCEALIVGRDDPGEIHLLLTDVIMPEINGKILAEEIKAVRPQMKVLFMSGYTDNVIGQHGINEKSIHFLPKPFSPQVLALKVRETLDGA